MQGSLVNRLMESSRYPEIKIGMGATVCMYSDRHPYTVVAVRYAKDGKTIHEIDILGDHVSKNLAVWPAQRYEITPAETAVIDGVLRRRLPLASGWDPNPVPVQTWRMDRTGRLRKTYINPETGKRVMAPKGSDGLSLGDRDYYQDPSF